MCSACPRPVIWLCERTRSLRASPAARESGADGCEHVYPACQPSARIGPLPSAPLAVTTINWRDRAGCFCFLPLIVFVLYRVMSRSLPEPPVSSASRRAIISARVLKNLWRSAVIRALFQADSRLNSSSRRRGTQRCRHYTIRVGRSSRQRSTLSTSVIANLAIVAIVVVWFETVCLGRKRHRAGPDHRHGERHDADALALIVLADIIVILTSAGQRKAA